MIKMKYVVNQSGKGFLFFVLGLISIVLNGTDYRGFLLGLIFVIYSLCFVVIKVEK